MPPISNLLNNYPKHGRVHVVWLHIYDVQEQAKLIEITETGNIIQPFGSWVGMTPKERKRTLGLKKMFSILIVYYTVYYCQMHLSKLFKLYI